MDDEEKAQALKELRQMANELAKAGQLKPDLLLDEDQNIVSGLEDIYFSFEGLDLSEEQFQGECPVCLTSTSFFDTRSLTKSDAVAFLILKNLAIIDRLTSSFLLINSVGSIPQYSTIFISFFKYIVSTNKKSHNIS